MRGYCPRCGDEVDEVEYMFKWRMCVNCYLKLYDEQQMRDYEELLDDPLWEEVGAK